MNADDIKASYAAELKEVVVVRRLFGTGSNRPKFEAEVRGKAWGEKSENRLVGTVQEYDWRVLVMVEDLIAKGFALPLTTADKLQVMGKTQELTIVNPDSRRAPEGLPVVYDIRAKG